MWRISTARYYQQITGFILLLETSLIVIIASLLSGAINPNLSAIGLLGLLELSIIISGAILIFLFVTMLIYKTVSDVTDKSYNDVSKTWVRNWTQAYFTETYPETLPKHPAIRDAFLSVAQNQRSVLSTQWAIQAGYLAYWRKQLLSTNKIKVIDAIIAIATVGTIDDLKQLEKLSLSRDPDIAIKAVRAIAFISSRASEVQAIAPLAALVRILVQRKLPVFIIEKLYKGVESHNFALKTYIISQRHIPEHLLLATINSITTNYEAHFADKVADYLYHDSPVIQIAILRMCETLNFIPERIFREVLLATRHDQYAIRTQALNTLRMMPMFRIRLTLWLALGDAEWSVQLAAANVLMEHGEEGKTILTTASIKHPNPDAKEVAKQVLETPTT